MSPQHVEHTNKNFETSTFHYCDLKFSIFIISQLNSYLKIQWFQIRAWIRLIRAKFCEKSRVQDSEKLFLRTVFIDFPRKFWYKRLSISRGFYIRIYARNKKKRLSVLLSSFDFWTLNYFIFLQFFSNLIGTFLKSQYYIRHAGISPSLTIHVASNCRSKNFRKT